MLNWARKLLLLPFARLLRISQMQKAVSIDPLSCILLRAEQIKKKKAEPKRRKEDTAAFGDENESINGGEASISVDIK